MSDDVELAGFEQKRFFANEHITDQAAADGIHDPDKDAGGNGQACFGSLTGAHDSVSGSAQRIYNKEWLGEPFDVRKEHDRCDTPPATIIM